MYFSIHNVLSYQDLRIFGAIYFECRGGVSVVKLCFFKGLYLLELHCLRLYNEGLCLLFLTLTFLGAFCSRLYLMGWLSIQGIVVFFTSGFSVRFFEVWTCSTSKI